MAQVDAAQDNLAVAIGYQAGDLINDIFNRAAGKTGPDSGNDAVGAVEQTAILHLDKGALVACKAANSG